MSTPFTLDRYNPFARRARICRLARRAFVKWGEASAEYCERRTDLAPCADCINRAFEKSAHASRRYFAIESAISEESGLPATYIYNRISNWQAVCPELFSDLITSPAPLKLSEWDKPAFSGFGPSYAPVDREAEARRQRAERLNIAA